MAHVSNRDLPRRSFSCRKSRRAKRIYSKPRQTVPLPFDATAARAFGRVSASLRQAGRKTSARAYDAMIAAIATANDVPVYTCKPDDFSGIDGLKVIAIPVPAK